MHYYQIWITFIVWMLSYEFEQFLYQNNLLLHSISQRLIQWCLIIETMDDIRLYSIL
jgi:hypothetical protein